MEKIKIINSVAPLRRSILPEQPIERTSSEVPQKTILKTIHAYLYFALNKEYMIGQRQYQFIGLDKENNLIFEFRTMAHDLKDAAIADVFKRVEKTNVVKMFSGVYGEFTDFDPDNREIEIFAEIQHFCNEYGIDLADHIFMTDSSYYSFLDNKAAVHKLQRSNAAKAGLQL